MALLRPAARRANTSRSPRATRLANGMSRQATIQAGGSTQPLRACESGVRGGGMGRLICGAQRGGGVTRPCRAGEVGSPRRGPLARLGASSQFLSPPPRSKARGASHAEQHPCRHASRPQLARARGAGFASRRVPDVSIQLSVRLTVDVGVRLSRCWRRRRSHRSRRAVGGACGSGGRERFGLPARRPVRHCQAQTRRSAARESPAPSNVPQIGPFNPGMRA
jgi:hypothetical protein